VSTVRPSLWALVAAAVAVIVAVAVLPFVLGHSSGPAASPQHGRSGAAVAWVPTRVHAVSPVDGAGGLRAGYRLGRSGRGHCFSSSLVDGRLYRCFLGTNTILDPCWPGHGRSAVLCLAQPWSHRVVRIRLTAPLPRRTPFPPRLWGLRVGRPADVGCVAAMGATGTVGGQRISFLCAGGWALLGDAPDRRTPAWTMRAARRVGDRYRARGIVHLTAAWRVVP
jgi:hypothetical protein